MRESFILYTKYDRQLEKLSNEQRGILFTAIMKHQKGEELPEMDLVTEVLYSFMIDEHEYETSAYAKLLARSNREYRQWRLQVLERDGRRCQKCGSTEDIEVHHIIPFAQNEAMRYVVDNGIALCHRCHRKAHRKK